MPAINLSDSRYIRRPLAQVAVLRELVLLQHCKTIYPSEKRIALFTNLSERTVRRALVKLAKSGLISYNKHRRDVRRHSSMRSFFTMT